MLSSEVEEEIIVEAKRIDSISDWNESGFSFNQKTELAYFVGSSGGTEVSSTSLNSEEIFLVDAQHPKQVFSRVPGIWISRGSGQHLIDLTSIRSPPLTGPGACGSFLILEDGILTYYRDNLYRTYVDLFECKRSFCKLKLKFNVCASSLEVIRLFLQAEMARFGSYQGSMQWLPDKCCL